VCIAIGAQKPRDLEIEGRDLKGIHFAMDFLSNQNRINAGQTASMDSTIYAENKKVVIIGGGDTGSDCVGTSIRQKASNVTQIEILPKPPEKRADDNPWPYFAKILKTTTSHEEGCERFWSLSTVRFIGQDGYLKAIEIEEVEWEKKENGYNMKVKPDTKRIIETDLVLLAMGFLHPIAEGLVSELQLDLDLRKNIKVNSNHLTTHQKVFAAGDSISGASLVVNAIASGRKAAKEIDKYLKEPV
jgi:glutamate synthase (NADPH) small chain